MAILLMAAAGIAVVQGSLGGMIHREADGHLYQSVSIDADRGALCTISRGGREIANLMLPQYEGLSFSTGDTKIDITESHDDLLVSCSRDGVSKSRSVQWTVHYLVADGGICSRQGNTVNICPSAHWAEMGYPTTINLISKKQR